MKFVALILLLATCFVCACVTTIMAAGGIVTGRVGYLYGRPPVVLKERPALFLFLCSLYVVMTLLYAVGMFVSAVMLYKML
jgi:hypothetical protein